MKKAATLIFIGLLFLMTGCNFIPSVHPLYTDQDLIFDPLLVGVWADKDGNLTWTFTKKAENAYTLLYVDEKGKKGEFTVHLLEVGDRRVLDIYAADPDIQQNDFYKCHLLPVHTFMRMQQQGDGLQMASLKQDWIKKYLQEHPDAIKHEKVDDGILLTAQSKDMQAFLLKHDKTADAWDECSLMKRRGDEPKK